MEQALETVSSRRLERSDWGMGIMEIKTQAKKLIWGPFLFMAITLMASSVLWARDIERVSVASDGSQSNDSSHSAFISADGRYVAFYSSASNLVSGDTNGMYDVFVHDRRTGQTIRLSAASDGSQSNDLSQFPSISADGRYVAFESNAGNLVLGDTNESSDVCVTASFDYRHVRPDGWDIILAVQNNCLLPAAPCKTFQHALGQSSGLDVIRLAQGVYQENVTMNEQRVCGIEGGWNNDYSKRSEDSSVSRIDGGNMDSVLAINAQANAINLSLSRLTLKNGKYPIPGTIGCEVSVQSDQAYVTLKLDHCTLTDNQSAVSIYSNNEGKVSVALDSSIMANNHTGAYGGAIDVLSLQQFPLLSEKSVHPVAPG
jgi:hypothetical protein